MSDNKKYYYLKLKEDFFKNSDIQVLESLENGFLYSNILLKLYLMSLKDNGKLLFKDNIPYDSKMLSILTGHNIDVVEKAIRIFKEYGIIDILDTGEIYMLEIESLIGQTNTESERKARYRQKISEQKQLNLTDGTMSHKCPGQSLLEIEIDIEKEKEINILCPTQTNIPYKKITEIYNSICTSLPKIKSLTEARKKHIKARWQDNSSITEFEEVFKSVQASDFLTGRNGIWTNCNFDWIIKESNWIKIQEGNYNKVTEQVKKVPGFLQGKTIM